MTVLLGPNNEGKSNLLLALVTAMRALEEFHQMSRRAPGHTFEVIPSRAVRHAWEEHFPVSLQETMPQGESVIVLEFELTESETRDFRKITKSNLNGTLPIKLAVGPKWIKFSVPKQGPSGRTLSQAVGQVTEFVSSRINFQYIPAVRTASAAQRVVDDLIARELSALEANQEYKQAISKIEQLQTPVLEKISVGITKTLQDFLPDIKKVEVGLSTEQRYNALRRASEIIVDDGDPTDLSAKGDGAQSLAAISLIRYASSRGSSGRNLILAVEEPESHLHPHAKHRLRQVLSEIANQHQVIITTHDPIFVEQSNIAANIVVEKQKARAAKDIGEIRQRLGVRISDNLQNSEVVLVVEGKDDEIAVKALLEAASPILKRAIASRRLGIDTLLGALNLPYKAAELSRSICRWHCLLDFDKGGQDAYRRANDEGLATLANVTFTRCKGKPSSEIEDWYDSEVYADHFKLNYGDILESNHFKNHQGKWSDRMKNAFEKLGKPWDDHLCAKIKLEVAHLVAKQPNIALLQKCRPPFDDLVGQLINLLKR